MNLRYTFAALGLTLPSPALAANVDWDQTEDAESCSFSTVFEDETSVLFLQTKPLFDSETVFYSLNNEAWSIKEGQPMPGEMLVQSNHGEYFSNASYVSAYMDHGVASAVKEEDLKKFTYILVSSVSFSYGGKTLLVANWDTFRTAYQRFDECRRKKGWLAERQAKKDEADRIAKEKRYREKVPVDPFAPTPPKKKSS